MRIRTAVHVHSDWSYDGRLSLDELASLFAQHGYDAVLMCEHDRGFTRSHKDAYDAACAEASAGGALLVPGIEYADADDRIHLPVWGSVPFLDERLPTDYVLGATRDHGGVAVIAHPRRREAWRLIKPAWLASCTGIEVWTRKWDGWAPNPWAVEQAVDQGLLEIASLDLHHRGQMFPLAMELELAAPLSVDACVHALRDGAARPLIRGLPAARLLHGPLARTATKVERLRRPVWRRGRLMRDRLVSTR